MPRNILPSLKSSLALPIVTMELQINSKEKLLDIFLKERSERDCLKGVGLAVCFVSVDQCLPSALQLMVEKHVCSSRF